MKCPKTTADDRDDLVLDVQCGSNTALVHLSKLRQGSRAASVLFEGRWLSPNQFQCVSGRRTTKDWKRSIRHHGKTLRQLMGQGVLTVDPPTCDCGTCKDSATKENTSPDALRSAGKAYEPTDEGTKGETTTPIVGGVVTVAATKGAGVVSALLDKSRDTQQCARAMVVELSRRGDCAERKTQQQHKSGDLVENEKPRDIVTSTTTAPERQKSPGDERVPQVAQENEKKTVDEGAAPCDKMQQETKEEARNVTLVKTEYLTTDIASTTATPFTDMYRTAQRNSEVSPPISCDVNRTASSESDKAPTSPRAFRDVVSRKSPKTGSDRDTPEARLPHLHKVAQHANKQHVAAVDTSATGSNIRSTTSLGFTAPSIYQPRPADNNVIFPVRSSLAEISHVTDESPMSTVASREQAVTVASGLYSGLVSSGLTMSNRLAESKRDLDADKKRTGDGTCSTVPPLGNTPKKHATSRENSSSAMTPSGDSIRSEKRHSTSADEYSPEKRQRHGSAGEHSPRRVTSRTPERDTVPKPVNGGSDAKPSMYPWSELMEKSNYLGGMGLDWPLARSLYASLPYRSPVASLPNYCTGLCCNPYLGHVPSMPMMCGSTCQQPFCFSCYPMVPTKPLHGCLTGSLRHQTLPSAAVTPCGLLYPSHPLGYSAEHPHESAGYLKLHELAGLAPSYHGLASDSLAQSLAASAAAAAAAAKRRLASTDARSKTKRKCGDGTIVERPLDLSVRN